MACGSSAAVGVNAAATASRPAGQRGRMPARSVAMPNSRPPSIYGIPTPRLYIAGRAPRLTSLALPAARVPRRPSTNFGAVVASTGKIKPPGPFHLPGVDPRNADEEQEAHDRLQGGDDCPCAGGDRRQNVGWMDRLNDRENDPCHQSC